MDDLEQLLKSIKSRLDAIIFEIETTKIKKEESIIIEIDGVKYKAYKQ